jgi:hypothetical protein
MSVYVKIINMAALRTFEFISDMVLKVVEGARVFGVVLLIGCYLEDYRPSPRGYLGCEDFLA